MMNKILMAASLAFAAFGASAATYDWGSLDTQVDSQLAYVAAGNFSDVYLFSLSGGNSGVSSVVSLDLSSIFDISNGTYSLWMQSSPSGPVAGDQELASWSFDGTTGSATHAITLGAGNYYYVVNGDADGTGDGSGHAGIYSIATAVLPVPEPASLVMVLAGLGLIGLRSNARRQR